MKLAICAVATVACLAGVPCVAGAATAAATVAGVDTPITLAQYERDHWRWRHRHEGCREITVRERRGGEMIVKHIRKCD